MIVEMAVIFVQNKMFPIGGMYLFPADNAGAARDIAKVGNPSLRDEDIKIYKATFREVEP